MNRIEPDFRTWAQNIIMSMSAPFEDRLAEALSQAYKQGYRVTPEGLFISPSGEIIDFSKQPRTRYPAKTINTKHLFGKNFVIKIHKLAAYCFYGDMAFEKDVVVRHLNSNVLDISISNIVMGTGSQNSYDNPPEMNKRIAKIAREKSLEKTRLFTADEVRRIRDAVDNFEFRKRIIIDKLSKEYSVDESTIRKIWYRTRYKDII